MQETILYSDLVHPADLKRNGELSLGTEAALRRGSWGLLSINDAEQISLLEEARKLCSAEPSFLQSVPPAKNVASVRTARSAKYDSLQVLDLEQRACKTWCSGRHDLMARIATKGQFASRPVAGSAVKRRKMGECRAIRPNRPPTRSRNALQNQLPRIQNGFWNYLADQGICRTRLGRKDFL